REKIINDLNGSGLFSIIIDTTTDLTHLEQLAFVVRYVMDNGDIQERLLSVEVAKDATGKGLFGSFSSICEKYNINWKKELCAQAFDGASSMQGKYCGLKTYIQNENPRAVNVWCFAHILNLVVVNVCESSIYTKQFFSNVQTLTVFMSARKRNAEFIDNQTKIYRKGKILRLKNLSTTRWCSHHRAIDVIYHKYFAVITTLENLLKSEDATTIIQARGLYQNVSSFEFIAVMIFMRKLFAVTTPLSSYLQSPSLDYVEALCLIDSVQNRLKILRSEEQFY
ncbi:zinc finger MYM-type protein 1-like, partial [Aphis craccivora]